MGKDYGREDGITLAWLRYERGRAYNNRLVPNQYNLVNTNIEFFAGNQWVNIAQTPAMRKLPKPTFNIIKRVASLFVASLTSSAASVSFDELSYYSSVAVPGQEGAESDPLGGQSGGGTQNEEDSPATVATAEVQNLLEKLKMDYRIREALFDGVQTGDYCAHFWWDPEAIPYGGAFGPYRGEIRMELVDGINVMFGNPNTPDVERQPYILIVGRATVAELRQEMEAHRKKDAAAGDITPDADLDGQAGVGGRTELEGDSEDGKALYVYMYEKRQGKDGPTIYVTKATKSTIIFEDVDTGLSRYPIAWGNWEKQKNQYHGRALVTGIIPNQIFINTMFAMVMRHLQLMGFPKTVYNAAAIGQWSNEVGQAIAVHNMVPGQDVRQMAYNLQPADMSNQIIMAIDKAVSYTKDCLGATDAQLGNVKPDNTSALMVLQSSAEVPLENTRAGLYEWLEDIGAILLDMMGTYYGKRPVVRDRDFEEPVLGPEGMPMLDPMTGTMQTDKVTRRVAVEYDFSQFRRLWFNIRVNAGATNYFSEIAMVQTLDNLRRDGLLEAVDYFERIPDKLIPRKAELLQELRKRTMSQGQPGAAPPMMAAKGSAPVVGGPLSEDKALAGLPVGMQAKYDKMPASAQQSMRALGSMRGR
jgi:hypothetical protein